MTTDLQNAYIAQNGRKIIKAVCEFLIRHGSSMSLNCHYRLTSLQCLLWVSMDDARNHPDWLAPILRCREICRELAAYMYRYREDPSEIQKFLTAIK